VFAGPSALPSVRSAGSVSVASWATHGSSPARILQRPPFPFNIGVAAGEVVSFALAFALMRLVFARLLPASLASSGRLGGTSATWVALMIDRFPPARP